MLMPTRPPNPWLLLAAVADLVLAALHVLIIAVGPYGYAYFGAGSMAILAQQGSVIPTAVTVGITAVLVLWACYALSGAGVMRPLPLLRSVLWTISAVLVLRGLIVFPDVLRLVAGSDQPPRFTFFSASALVLGLVHAVGSRRLSRRGGHL
jgi:hypothetical protein